MLNERLASFRVSLASLAVKVPQYAELLRSLGFEACHAQDDWISQDCGYEDVSIHCRYLVEYAREVLLSEKKFNILQTDESNCQSDWLNTMKMHRLEKYGPVNVLFRSTEKRHLVELSPGLQELLRVRQSVSYPDRFQVASQLNMYAERRERELRQHARQIQLITTGLDSAPTNSWYCSTFANYLAVELASLGAVEGKTLVRNQLLRRDEENPVVWFKGKSDLILSILPVVVSSVDEDETNAKGTMTLSFRVTSQENFDAKEFDFRHVTILHLADLLPGGFNAYGEFGGNQEFGLNMLAWHHALDLLMPDVLANL